MTSAQSIDAWSVITRMPLPLASVMAGQSAVGLAGNVMITLQPSETRLLNCVICSVASPFASVTCTSPVASPWSFSWPTSLLYSSSVY